MWAGAASEQPSGLGASDEMPFPVTWMLIQRYETPQTIWPTQAVDMNEPDAAAAAAQREWGREGGRAAIEGESERRREPRRGGRTPVQEAGRGVGPRCRGARRGPG